jgi:hypothetical protein
MYMRSTIFLMFLFPLITTSTSSAYTTTKTYYFRNGYSLALVKNGINTFLNMIKKTGPLTYTSTLNDVIYDAPLNNIDISHLFRNLSNALSKRINRIENLQGKNIDLSTLLCGAGLVGISAGLIGAVYYCYKKYQVHNNKRFDELKQSLEGKGFGIVTVGDSITVVTPYPTSVLSVEEIKESQEIFEAHKKRKDFNTYAFIGVAAAFVSAFYGGLSINEGLYPHYDDAYLENYKVFLKITDYLRFKNLINIV